MIRLNAAPPGNYCIKWVVGGDAAAHLLHPHNIRPNESITVIRQLPGYVIVSTDFTPRLVLQHELAHHVTL